MWFLTKILPSFLLNWLGIAEKKGKFLLIGLDNAGKSTLLHLLKTGQFAALAPTYHGTSETLSMNNGSLLMTGIDLGGHHQVRRVWQDYYQSVDAVVFMVDAADPSRLTEAAEELKRVLDDNQLISEIPIAVLANKVDAQGCLGRSQLIYHLGLWDHLQEEQETQTSGSSRKIQLFCVSLKFRQGYGQAFRWISEFL